MEEREKELDRGEARLNDEAKSLNERTAAADTREKNRDAILVTERTMMEIQKTKIREERLKL